ncbi:hypothetical protein ANO11243_084180 [Dothideomycetidae sp. 11243]|nr:hypothetical protein ANO11243_084180 [fungal sp. No.11243]
MSSNQGAWINSQGERPLKVGPAEMPKAGPGQLVIRNHAVAINPLDWRVQDWGLFVQSYPVLAGEVVEVGQGVQDFEKGDRVLSYTNAAGQGFAGGKGAFQHYTCVEPLTTAKIPSGLSYAQATVLPLAICTASVGLYSPDFLGLPYPTHSPKSSGKVILLWGGSSAVGLAAIQLAKASGVDVVSTASSHNISLVKSAGADHVFDHKSSSIVDDIVVAIKSSGKEYVGVYDAISLPDSLKHVVAVVDKLGTSNKKLAATLPLEKGSFGDLDGEQLNAGYTHRNKELSQAIFAAFLPGALESGQFKAMPEPMVVGKGLESIQKGFDAHKAGVSAKKVVVELQ